MKSSLKWLCLAVFVFVLVGLVSHWDIALTLVGAPFFAVALGWAFERVFPHAYDSTLKDKQS